MILLLATMMAAQAAQPVAAPERQPVDVTGIKKKKPKQHCEYIDMSGSRMPKRVCTDINGNPNRDPNISDLGDSASMLRAPPGAAATAPGGMGSPPK